MGAGVTGTVSRAGATALLLHLCAAPGFGQPIVVYDVLSAGAQSYLALARELLGGNGIRPGQTPRREGAR